MRYRLVGFQENPPLLRNGIATLYKRLELVKAAIDIVQPKGLLMYVEASKYGGLRLNQHHWVDSKRHRTELPRGITGYVYMYAHCEQ